MNHLPTDAKARKAVPIYSGFLKYFPRAIAAVAELSRVGNEQHNPGKPLHWDRSKSGDELDALSRHLLDADGIDVDKVLHATKIAWRAMANLEKVLEKMEHNTVSQVLDQYHPDRDGCESPRYSGQYQDTSPIQDDDIPF